MILDINKQGFCDGLSALDKKAQKKLNLYVDSVFIQNTDFKSFFTYLHTIYSDCSVSMKKISSISFGLSHRGSLEVLIKMDEA